jgi:hypothetical protein
MIPSAVSAYAAARNSKNKNENNFNYAIPVFEKIEEARKSLIEIYGKQEYLITENVESIRYFDVMCIKDNKIWSLKYQKKITNYKESKRP